MLLTSTRLLLLESAVGVQVLPLLKDGVLFLLLLNPIHELKSLITHLDLARLKDLLHQSVWFHLALVLACGIFALSSVAPAALGLRSFLELAEELIAEFLVPLILGF